MILADSGHFIALIDAADVYHSRCLENLGTLPDQPLITTWPCISEAMHILLRSTGWRGQDHLWEMILAGEYRIHDTHRGELPRMRELMAKYADTPMDLADASLVSLAEDKGLKRIMSFDDHFFIYRIAGTESFDIIR